MADDDQTLVDFLDSLQGLLSGCVRGEPFRILPEHLMTSAKIAWDEVQQIAKHTRDWLIALRQVSETSIEAALSMVGLTGEQLQLKLKGYFAAVARGYRRVLNSYIRWLKECLRWANIILGSLSKVFAACEPLKEFKEVIEAALDYSGAASRRASRRDAGA